MTLPFLKSLVTPTPIIFDKVPPTPTLYFPLKYPPFYPWVFSFVVPHPSNPEGSSTDPPLSQQLEAKMGGTEGHAISSTGHRGPRPSFRTYTDYVTAGRSPVHVGKIQYEFTRTLFIALYVVLSSVALTSVAMNPH
eukprot:499326-Hanusia_phi.AAC.4